MKEQTIREIWELMDECVDMEHLVAQVIISHDLAWANNLMEELKAQMYLDELAKEET